MMKWLICHLLNLLQVVYHWINVKYDLYKLDLNFIAMFHMILNTMYKITTRITKFHFYIRVSPGKLRSVDATARNHAEN